MWLYLEVEPLRDHEDGDLMSGISARIKETPESFQALSVT